MTTRVSKYFDGAPSDLPSDRFAKSARAPNFLAQAVKEETWVEKSH